MLLRAGVASRRFRSNPCSTFQPRPGTISVGESGAEMSSLVSRTGQESGPGPSGENSFRQIDERYFASMATGTMAKQCVIAQSYWPNMVGVRQLRSQKMDSAHVPGSSERGRGMLIATPCCILLDIALFEQRTLNFQRLRVTSSST